MENSLNDILPALSGYREQIKPLCDILLSNLILVGEVPAPTFREYERSRVILSRFGDYKLLHGHADDMGNTLTMIPGTTGERTILVTAHIDTAIPDSEDSTISLSPDYAVGPGVADNGVGIATLITLPLILERLGLEFESNIILLCSSRSIGRGNTEGLRYFLSNTKVPITTGISLNGIELGMLSHYSLGILRADLTFRTPEQYDWTRFVTSGAIVNLNEALDRILEIPLPGRPRTNIVFGSVEGGTAYDVVATQATLRFEVRSESAETVETIGRTISDIAREIASRSASEAALDVIARKGPGGIGFSHPLTRASRSVMNSLGIESRIIPDTLELSAFIERNIPAVSIAVTHGDHIAEQNERIRIDPIPTGIAQLVGIMLAVDKGYTDADI